MRRQTAQPRSCGLINPILRALIEAHTAGGFIGSPTGCVTRGDPWMGRRGAGRPTSTYRCRIQPRSIRRAGQSLKS